jgi:hypothetical protein
MNLGRRGGAPGATGTGKNPAGKPVAARTAEFSLIDGVVQTLIALLVQSGNGSS